MASGILDVQRKCLYPSRFRAYGAGPPEYIQYWLEEGVCTQDRGSTDTDLLTAAGYTDGLGSYWNVAAENDYVDWCFYVPPGGFVLPAGDYVVALPLQTITNGDKCGLTVSYRCDAGAHIDSASEVFCDAITQTYNQNFLLIPLTVTAYTATSTASINIKCTSDDGFAEDDIQVCAWSFSESASAYGLIGPCIGLDTDQAHIEDWERELPSIVVTSPPASSHTAPALIAGIPSFQLQVEGLYPTDVISVTKYSDSDRGDTCDPDDARLQFEHVAVEAVTDSTGTVNAVSKVLTVASGWSPGSGIYQMAPPDACRDCTDGEATTWAQSTAYSAGALVLPTYVNEHYYKALDAGTSGTTEPVWPTDGTTIADNGIAEWEDQGERYEYGVNTRYVLSVRDRFPFSMIAKCAEETDYEPIAYWRLGEATGATTAVDEMGTLDLTITGATMGGTGLLANDSDTCAQLDGSNDYAYSDTPLWTAGNFPASVTVEMLFKDTVPGTTDLRTLFAVGAGANDFVTVLAGHSGTQDLYFRGKRGGSAWEAHDAGGAYTANATHHLVCTCDTSGPTVEIWVDGAKLTTSSTAGAYTWTGTAIGGRPGGSSYFEGYIDEVIVYERVLTDEEIAGHYQASIIGSTVIATATVEAMLDRNSPLSVTDSVDAPTLDAVGAGKTTADHITTTWTDPATWKDPQPLGYETEMTLKDGTILTKLVGTRNACYWGRLPAGTYSWRARSITPWGSVSSWTSADSFTIGLAASVPVVTLDPLPTTIWDQPRTTWTFTQAEGYAQTNFQVQLDDDSGFGSPTTYTGTTALYYQHSSLANGLWYRRVRVSCDSGVTWSTYDSDSFTLANPTSQSDSFDIYLDALGTPAELNLTTSPVSGLVITQRLDGAMEFSFAVNNWSGVSINKGEYIQLLVKDADGKRLEFMGEVQSLRRGRMLEVVCRDIASKFDLWPCEWSFGKTTLTNAIYYLITNPTGNAATGITTHIEDTTWTDPVTGNTVPITLQDWSGQGKSVGQVLSEFQRATGCRWYIESRSKAWHFWWWNSANAPSWTKTIRDDISYEAESATQLCLDDGDGYPIAQAEDGPKRNRVRYYARAAAPKMLPGWSTWDEWATESLTYWRNYGGITQSLSATTAPGVGSYAIKFDYSFTASAGNLDPVPLGFLDLGYIVVPRQYADMSSIHWGFLTGDVKVAVTNNSGIAAANTPRSDVWLQLILHSGANIGPSTATGCGINPSIHCSTVYTNTKWQIYENIDSRYNDNGDVIFDLANVTAIQVRAFCVNPKVTTAMTATKTWSLSVYLDHLQPLGASGVGGPATGQYYVETAAVTAGEVPIEEKLDDMGMNLEDASAWATLRLAQLQADAESISDIAVVGIQNIPLRKNIPLYLDEHYAINAAYPIAEIRWEPQVGQTTLTLGSIPADDLRRDEEIKRSINRLGAAVRSK